MEPKYNYLGFSFFDGHYYSVLFNSIIVSFFVWLMPSKIRYPSDIFSIFSYMFVVIPSFSVPLYTTFNLPLDQYYLMLFFMSIILALSAFLGRSENFLYSKFLLFRYQKIASYVLWTFTAFSFALVVFSYGFNIQKIFSLKDLSELYEIRDDFRSVNKGGAVFSAYFLPWLSKVIIPFFFAKSILEKKYVYALYAFFAQFILFGTSGQKSIFLSLIVVYAIIKLLSSKESGIKTLYLFMSFIVLSYGAYYILNFDFVADNIVRRSFIVPGLLTGYYVEFYSQNPLDGYSLTNSLGVTIDNNIPAAFEIGTHYMGRSDLSANANIYASAFSHFRLYGVVFEGFLLLIYLYILNLSVYRKSDKILCCCIATTPLLALNDSAFLTVLVTHGAILTFLIITFVVKDKEIIFK